MKSTGKQAFLYLQASIVGTLLNFVARFPLAEFFSFDVSVILSTYLGMVVVFLLSYKRAFAIAKPNWQMVARFALVAHVGLVVVWLGSSLSHACLNFFWPQLFQTVLAENMLISWNNWLKLDSSQIQNLAFFIPRLAQGFCHGLGIIAGFFVNFIGHKVYSFAPEKSSNQGIANLAAILIPIAYLVLYGPYAIDTTDFGFFYGYPWRILQGEVPYRDFYYTKPPASLYWHSFWLWISPIKLSILLGKLGFIVQMLASAWLGSLVIKNCCKSLLSIPLPLLATLGFVFGVHAFPAMPWHTADGVLLATACLYAASRGWACLAGLLGILAVLTKQSFLGVPLGSLVILLMFYPSWFKALLFLGSSALTLLAFTLSLQYLGAWHAFLSQTTGGLSLNEAVEAGIVIYLKQNWYIPGLALGITLGAHVLSKYLQGGKTYTSEQNQLEDLRSNPSKVENLSSDSNQPDENTCSQLKTYKFKTQAVAYNILSYLSKTQFFIIYTLIFSLAYLHLALTSKEWIGYGTSWPTFYFVLGLGYALYALVTSWLKGQAWQAWLSLLILLAVAWSTGISGGYKTPAFFALPLLFSALLMHQALGGKAITLAWLSLACGLLIFRVGYETPYTFPSRPMPRSNLIHDAGQVFPRLSGVQVDEESLGILQDLKTLRSKYGANYKTLPGFPLAYLLTNDPPALSAEWLQDWEINYETDKLYQELLDKDLTVFFEKSQLDTISPDKYARTRYTVPQKVKDNWKKIDETKYFIVYRQK